MSDVLETIWVNMLKPICSARCWGYSAQRGTEAAPIRIPDGRCRVTNECYWNRRGLTKGRLHAIKGNAEGRLDTVARRFIGRQRVPNYFIPGVVVFSLKELG